MTNQPGELGAAIPIPMLLWCPKCNEQHIDAASDGWDNPAHRSHLCHECGCIWRPADVATTGVADIKTAGEADTWGWTGGDILLPSLGKRLEAAQSSLAATPTRNDGAGDVERMRRAIFEEMERWHITRDSYGDRICRSVDGEDAEIVTTVSPGDGEMHMCDLQADAVARAAFSALSQKGGWQLAPVEPTPEMLNAAVDRTGAGNGMSWANRSPQGLFETGYLAMLAAAPVSAPHGGDVG